MNSILAAAVLALLSCGGGNGVSPKVYSITLADASDASLVLGHEAATRQVVFSSAQEWTASTINDRADGWLEVTPQKGTAGDNCRIDLILAENTEEDERNATIEIASGNVKQNVSLVQKEKDALVLSSDRVDIGCDGGKVELQVRSNLEYSVNIETAAQSWISAVGTKAATSSSIALAVAENKSKSPRSGKVTVSGGALEETVTVYQEGLDPTIIISSRKVEVSDKGGTFQVEVKANVDVEVSIQNASWLKEATTKALSTSTYSFTAEANPTYLDRQASLVFRNVANGISETVTVLQKAKVLEHKTTEFDESAIVASFGVISDTHVNADVNSDPGKKLLAALQQLKAKALVNDAGGLDGVLVAGDLIDNACYSASYYQPQTSAFKSIYESVFDPSDVPMIYTVGNHDVLGFWTDNTYSEAGNIRKVLGSKYFELDEDKEMSEDYECRHCVVGGVHVLCVSPLSHNPVAYHQKVLDWLDSKLDELTRNDPDRYVLILSHAMIYGTVYGSDLVSAGVLSTSPSTPSYWYTSQLTPILDKYPQAVTFGGHLHFPLQDPRSIMQGNFTSFGTASVRYMAFEGGSYYINKAGATILNDRNEFSEGLMIQIDASGNMRATRMDFYRNAVIGEPWDLSYPSGTSHLEKYSRSTREAANVAPSIASLDVVLGSTMSSSVPCTAKWPAAVDDDFAHHYELTLTPRSGASTTVWIMSDFYRCDTKEQMAKEYSYNFGNLPVGTYSVSLEAVDSWGSRSTTLVKEFKVEGATIDPNTLPEAYSDIDFAGGNISDSKGKVSITNHSALAASTSVAFGGSNYNVDALSVGTGKVAVCQFSELTTSSSFRAFAQNGFTVEAFYVDKTGSSATQGVVCGTEGGGWGLAVAATGLPYFIAGTGASSNTYASVYAKNVPSRSELTHVMCVYDPANGLLKIYVNGVLDATKTGIPSAFFPGTGNTFNKFCLGADIKSTEGFDFPSVNMVIADAKIYDVALNDVQVKLAYDKAVAQLNK